MERPDRTLDVVGLHCPVPFMKILENLLELEPDQILEVLSDEREIGDDVESACKRTGNIFLGMREEEGLFRAYIRKA